MILIIAVLSMLGSHLAWGTDQHDHFEHREDGEALSALSRIRGQLEDLNHRARPGEISLEDSLLLRRHLADAVARSLQENQDRDALGLARTPLAVRAVEKAQHYVMHLNPVALARWTMSILRKYGPGVTAGFVIMESTEQWAGYYALTGSIPLLRAAAGLYNITHLGDMLFASVLFGTPYVLDRMAWVGHFIKNYGDNPVRYLEDLRALRRALPIDWSLNPYLDPSSEFLVLNPGSWRRRLLPNLRHTLQRESFPTVALADLETLARRRGVALPSSTLGFHARTELLVAGIKTTLEGTLDLDSLVARAHGQVRLGTSAAGTGPSADAATIEAERLRTALLAHMEHLAELDQYLRHRPAHRLLSQSLKDLRRLTSELLDPATARTAARIIASFEEHPGLYRGDVTSHEIAQAFGWDIEVAKRSLQFFGWLSLARAQEEARQELSTARLNVVLRLHLLERIGEAETFWQLSEALRLVADSWPEDYAHILNPPAEDDHDHDAACAEALSRNP